MKRHETGRAVVFGVLWGLAALGLQSAEGSCVISELMYSSPHGGRYEYVEITNPGDARSIAGWSLDLSVRFSFPAATEIPAGGLVVVVEDREAFLAAYPDLDPSSVFGNWLGSLANEGETVLLRNAAGALVDAVNYDDDAPWDFLADGFGPSLERVCLTESADLPENWRASPTPEDPNGFGGTPLAPATVDQCPPVGPARPAVRITEVMYHPVLEEAYEDNHEFVEIANAGATPVTLTGWRFVGGIDFVFPEVTLSPDQYLVIAFDREALLAVEGYDLDPTSVIGDYGAPGSDGEIRSLDNGGEKIALITEQGVGVDSMSYDDDAPWPIGADALGAGSSWLPDEWLPMENHRYRGRSLERVSMSWASNAVANWVASPLDGPTPGRPNTIQRETPLAIVEDVDLTPREPHPADPLLRAADEVRVAVTFTAIGTLSNVAIEYYVEDIDRDDETRFTLALADDGVDPDMTAADSVYTGVLPPQDERTIVRYRVLADRGDGQEVLSPRPSDPFTWHAYSVSPVIQTERRVYEVFISQNNWRQMYINVSPGRVPGGGCSPPNPRWNLKVPAIFVYNGKVYDVWLRHQGSRWNRTNGASIATWNGSWPPGVPRTALSWHINFPRYDQMEGLRIVTLNKLTQACPGLTSAVGYRFFEAVGIPSPRQRFVRFYVNGNYYRFMMEHERPGEVMLNRWIRENREMDPDFPEKQVGHFFKSAGCNCDEGPYGWGDGRRLPARCEWSALERYEWTFDPKTHEWAGGQRLMDIIEELHVAKAEGPAAVRDYLVANWDLDMLGDYCAIINWAVPFDDMFQNHFWYQRSSDGKWFLTPWDLDRDFGEYRGGDNQGPNCSIYYGEQGDRSNRSGWWHHIKDAYIKSFRAEYEERLMVLNETILTPENMGALVDAVVEGIDVAEVNAAASRMSCSLTGRANEMKNFAVQRQRYVRQVIPPVKAVAGPDQRVYVGDEVQFDARGSRPDPDPDVTYVWSNGMTGEFPTHVFDQAGEHEITLTITVEEKEYTDSVIITVLSADWVFVEQDGTVVVEAESVHALLTHGEEQAWWEEASQSRDYSGGGYMSASHIDRRLFSTSYQTRAPELIYMVNFTNPGTYYIWIRALTDNTRWDSIHVGLDGVGTTRYQTFEETGAWGWSNLNTRDERQMLEVTEPGLHELSLWMRESGILIDKIILTTDADLEPTGQSLDESDEVLRVGAGAFMRGDVNIDRRVNISDAITTLRFVFSNGTIACEDHADANDDGAVNVADPIYLLAHLFNNGPAPPAPYPSWGFDETADPFACGDRPDG